MWAQCTTGILIRRRQKGQSQRMRCDCGSRGQSDGPAGSKESEQLLETGKEQDTDFPREPPCRRNEALSTP